ncbi:MAG: hypothetical protein GXP49_08765 [Deltaproteobacteria bacterium]|nr:hypothetical protein [Deltaproteobacteria bacterium]
MFGDCFHDGLAGAKRKSAKVLCTCGNLFSSELIQLVEAEDTEIARHAKNGTLHRIRCPECHGIISVDAPYFFHAREEKKFIVVLPENWRHRALEARSGFYAALMGARDENIPGYVVQARFVFGRTGLLEELGEPARRSTDKATRRSPVKAVEELVEQVVDEMIEEVIESPADLTGGTRDQKSKTGDGDGTRPGLKADSSGDEDTISLDNSNDVEEFTDFKDMDEEDLLRLLNDKKYSRDAALALVDKNGDANAGIILARFFVAGEMEKDALFPAVLRLGRSVSGQLMEKLKKGDLDEAKAAARALSALRIEEAADYIQARLRGRLKTGDAESFCSALSSMGGKGRKILKKELANPSWSVRASAVSALSRSCGPACLEDILSLNKDRSVRVRKAVRDAVAAMDLVTGNSPDVTGDKPI